MGGRLEQQVEADTLYSKLEFDSKCQGRGWECCSVVELVLSMHEALGSIPLLPHPRKSKRKPSKGFFKGQHVSIYIFKGMCRIGENQWNLELSEEFLRLETKSLRGKIEKFNFIKMKTFSSTKVPSEGVENLRYRQGEKCLQITYMTSNS